MVSETDTFSLSDGCLIALNQPNLTIVCRRGEITAGSDKQCLSDKITIIHNKDKSDVYNNEK